MRLPCLAVILIACTRPVPQDEPPPADEQDEMPVPLPEEMMPTPMAPVFGLDDRPTNPACFGFTRPTSSTGVSLENVFPALSFSDAVWAERHQLVPDGPFFWFVIERSGTLSMVKSPTQKVTVLTIAGADDSSGETGFLAAAFDPDFATNHTLYAYYIGDSSADDCTIDTDDTANQMCSYLSRYVVTTTDGGDSFTQTAEKVMMKIDQPATNHKGGAMGFDQEGLLYLSLGDGGRQNDNYHNGQNVSSPLAKLLRIDVRGKDAYTIPPGNPYASSSGSEDKRIFAMGMRNPWRWTFDRGTIPWSLWVGDVGGGAKEEVDRIEIGKNYGWPCREGGQAGPVSSPDTRCPNGATYAEPLVDYGHSGGRTAIVGGYVYRGTAIPALAGSYLYADHATGEVWALPDPYAVRTSVEALPASVVIDAPFNVPSFSEDESHELYVVRRGGSVNGIYKLVPSSGVPSGGLPAQLSATGCVSPSDPSAPGPGLIPYAINAPFWSDGAEKDRWFAIPDGEQLTIAGDRIVFPIGSVFVKRFRLQGQLVETRLLVRHADGDWAGYTYRWNAAQTDATLVAPGGLDISVGTQVWHLPAQNECLGCHTDAAGRSIGAKLTQMNRDFAYAADRTSNQLATYTHIGVLPAVSGAPSFAGVDAARIYLHANCAHCHAPGGGTSTVMDMRYDTALADSQICAKRTEITARMHADDATHMPKGLRITDPDGANLVDAFLSTCP